MDIVAYKKTVIETTDKVQIVLMLYDGALSHLNRAKLKISSGDNISKGHHFSKATSIVSELSNVLDMEKGGDISINLRRLYDYVLQRLLYANMHNDIEAVEEAEKVLNTIRGGWKEMMDGMKHNQNQPVGVSIGG
jgi:flagellar protein FliS